MIEQNEIYIYENEPVRVTHYAHPNAIAVVTLKGKGCQVKDIDLFEINPDDYKPKSSVKTK